MVKNNEASLEFLHRFTLGHFTHYKSNNEVCDLCKQPYTTTSLEHRYEKCPFAKLLWQKFAPTNMRNHFRYYIANPLLTLSQSQQLSKFIAAIAAMEQKWKTDQPGPPLLEKDLKDWIPQFSHQYNSKLPYK